jgi:hypothetical protein
MDGKFTEKKVIVISSTSEPSVASTGGSTFNAEVERAKILNGDYPSRIQKGKQRKHISGTREFNQQRKKMNRFISGSEPAILNPNADAQDLVNQYKGTGIVEARPGSDFPHEIVKANRIIGKTWVKRMQKYVDTDTFVIVYSKEGVHIYPRSSI